jgi:putative nucleotidyltransferase with HDIG domain
VRQRVVIVLCLVVLVGALLTSAGTWDDRPFDPVTFGLLLAMVLLAEGFSTAVGRIQISGSFLGLLLSMAILGPSQAAIVGFAVAAMDIVRERPRPAAAAVNMASWTASAVAGGVVMLWLSGLGTWEIAEPEFALALLAGFVVAMAVNSAASFGFLKAVDGVSLRAQVRDVLVPILPSELATGLLAAVILFAYGQVGPVALGLLGALFFLYLVLVRELLLSQDRARELDQRTRELASLQVGVLTTMLKTLALRDHMTARHSAAVARYARALAREAGCDEREQELVHTAGLLHDIGKFIFPDRILLASTRLDDGDWEIVKRHPYQGARLVGQIDGYGPVADIILGHHERVDGRGYPRGLKGDEIPLLSRCISVADTYDVMTSRDSYRDPVPAAAAIAELQRVAGSQLDAGLVALFVALHERGELAFGHGDDADFESELQFERRVSEYAAPRPLRLAA